jgi:hypothetical protein
MRNSPVDPDAIRLVPELGGRAAQGSLVENPLAVGADHLLDLVRDPCVLTQCVRDHGLVLVNRACSSAELLGHRSHVSHRWGQNMNQKGEEMVKICVSVLLVC